MGLHVESYLEAVMKDPHAHLDAGEILALNVLGTLHSRGVNDALLRVERVVDTLATLTEKSLREFVDDDDSDDVWEDHPFFYGARLMASVVHAVSFSLFLRQRTPACPHEMRAKCEEMERRWTTPFRLSEEERVSFCSRVLHTVLRRAEDMHEALSTEWEAAFLCSLLGEVSDGWPHPYHEEGARELRELLLAPLTTQLADSPTRARFRRLRGLIPGISSGMLAMSDADNRPRHVLLLGAAALGWDVVIEGEGEVRAARDWAGDVHAVVAKEVDDFSRTRASVLTMTSNLHLRLEQWSRGSCGAEGA